MKKITFTLAADSNKAVVADKYVAHALYTQNEAIVEGLGGKVIRGVGEFRAEFSTVAKAKKFLTEAITEMSKKEYNAARKIKPADEGSKKSKPKNEGKGNKKSKSTRTGKGNVAPTKAVTDVKKPARKSKGNAELTEAGKKALSTMKTSLLNRAASAYSIANGGEATTFSALGKSAKELNAYIPKAKEGLLKSSKWAKASETHGLTEDMLG